MITFRVNPPIHPGEMLRTEFMEPLNMSAGQLARALQVPRTRIERLVREQSGVTADTAARLAQYFGMTEEFWMNLQSSYELDCLHADKAAISAIQRIARRPRPEPDDGAAEAA